MTEVGYGTDTTNTKTTVHATITAHTKAAWDEVVASTGFTAKRVVVQMSGEEAIVMSRFW